MTTTAPRTRRRQRRLGLAAALVTTTVLAGLSPFPARGETAPPAPASPELVTLGDTPPGLSDVDKRGTALPTATQRTAASRLGAALRWNDFGTPASILPTNGSLGRASSTDAVVAARSWLACPPRRARPEHDAGRRARAGQQPAVRAEPGPGGAVPADVRRPLPRDRQHGHGRRRRRTHRLRLLLADPHHRPSRRPPSSPRCRPGRRPRPTSAGTGSTSTRSPHWSRPAGPGSGSPASPRSSRCACGPSPSPTAPCARCSRPTSSTSPAARRSPPR